MYKIGIDAVTISRLEKSLGKPGFIEKVFSRGEIAEFFGNRKRCDSLAANFAAKEALSKALGTGIRGFSLPEAEVLRDEKGMPYFNFYGKLQEIILENGYEAAVSLSHEGDMAFAVVLLQEAGPVVKNL